MRKRRSVPFYRHAFLNPQTSAGVKITVFRPVRPRIAEQLRRPVTASILLSQFRLGPSR